MGNYYCLIAGLPELQLDDQKLIFSLANFKTELEENLSVADLQLISYFFMQFDNTNLIELLRKPDAEFKNNLGNISHEAMIEIIAQLKESDNPSNPSIYSYFKNFVPNYLNNIPILPTMSWADQLTSLYYDYAVNCKNKFIAEWYEYNLIITNLMTAVNCMRYNFDRESAIIGSGEIVEAIRTSNSRDFGIAPLFSEVEEVLKIAELPDIYERERLIDQLRWNWLEEKGFFHYFDVEHLFIYLLKLEMLQRWIILEKETGLKIFRDMIGKMQQSFEFPNEFTVKQVK